MLGCSPPVALVLFCTFKKLPKNARKFICADLLWCLNLLQNLHYTRNAPKTIVDGTMTANQYNYSGNRNWMGITPFMWPASTTAATESIVRVSSREHLAKLYVRVLATLCVCCVVNTCM